MRWITRERAKVDRIACPWLISRFIDPHPEFLYVAADRVLAEAAMQGAIPYDIPDIELGHKGPFCSFDALMDRYGLQGKDPALDHLALIVRGADTAEEGPDTRITWARCHCRRIQQMGLSDHEKLAHEFPVYDALYVYCGGKLPNTTTVHERGRIACVSLWTMLPQRVLRRCDSMPAYQCGCWSRLRSPWPRRASGRLGRRIRL